jgi:hypothetical protein
MGLVLRLVTGSALSYPQMDDNLIYLDNKVTGSTGYITYFSGSSPTASAVGQSLLFQTGSRVLMTGSFAVQGAISASFFVGNGSQLTGITVDKIGLITTGSNSSTQSITGSLLISGSFRVTGSISNNTTVTTTALITPQTVTEAITIPNNFNGMLIGPVNLNANVTVAGNATLVIV